MVKSILDDGEEKGRERGRDGELREAGFGDVYRSLMDLIDRSRGGCGYAHGPSRTVT